MTVGEGTSSRPPSTIMAPAYPIHHIYPYSNGRSAAYHPPPPVSYPTPAHPLRRPTTSSYYEYSVDPWSSSHQGQPHVGGGEAAPVAELGSVRGEHSRRLSWEANHHQQERRNPSPFLRVSNPPGGGDPVVVPYEVLPPYPTPAFDRHYYRHSPSPSGHVPPSHLPATTTMMTVTTHRGGLQQQPQQYYPRPPQYANQPSRSEDRDRPYAAIAETTPLHPRQATDQPYIYSDRGAGDTYHYQQHGHYYSTSRHGARRISLQPPLPPVAGGTAPTFTPQEGVPQVTTHKKKARGADCDVAGLLNDKSPTTMSFERILECATLIATGPRQTPTTATGAAGTRLTAEDATNLAHRLAVADDDNGRQSFNGQPPAEPTPVPTTAATPLPLHNLTNVVKPILPSPVLPASMLEPGNPFAEIARDPDLYKQVVLQMALEKQAYDEPRVRDFTVSPVIGAGFFWRDYPPLEQILFDNMADYYLVTAGRRQSKLQQSFTTRLADKVRLVAAENGWSFSATMGEKILRDRIRCFYKTHLQNAKKRLVTLQKHPESSDHRSALRVYVRSVRLGISVEASERQEPMPRTKSVTRSRLLSVSPRDGSPPLRGEILTALKEAHQSVSKDVTESPPPGNDSEGKRTISSIPKEALKAFAS